MKKILILSSITLLALAFPTACSSDDDDDTGGSGGSGAVGGGGVASGGTSNKTTVATGGKATGGTNGSTVGGAGGNSNTSTKGGAGGGAGTPGTAGASVNAAGMAGTAGSDSGAYTKWVGTWATSQQATEVNNIPVPPTASGSPMPDDTGIANSTLRQAVRISVGGSRFRLQLSNKYGVAPVTFESVHVAKSLGGGAIDVATDKALAFSGQASVTLAAGTEITTDAFDFAAAPLTELAISIKFGAQTKEVTGHPGSRTTSYLKRDGNFVSAATMADATIKPVHWYYISTLDVLAPETAGSIAVLGDSLTDGRGTTNDGNDRWTDILASRLQANVATKFVGVLNHGVGGNNLVSGGLGIAAKVRFDHDIISATGVKWMIILHGVNDIGTSTITADNTVDVVANKITATYQEFITKARAANIKAYGSPILPFGTPTDTTRTYTAYNTPEHQQIRDKVNAWIRTPGNFDAVIDLDAAVRDPNITPARLLQDYAEPLWVGVDYLHLNATGYKKMGDSVNLALFQ